MIVTEYVPFQYFTRTASRYRRKYGIQSNHAMLWCGTTRNQDSRGIGPRGVNRIHQAQGEPRESSVAWVSSLRDTWHPDLVKRGFNTVGQVNPKECYLSRKDSGLQGGNFQVIKPCKCGRREPGSHLANVWNGHPAGPCPRQGDASGRIGSDSDGALQPWGGVC